MGSEGWEEVGPDNGGGEDVLTPLLMGNGLIRDYMRYVSVQEAPGLMHFASLLTLFSGAVERKLVIRRGYQLRANVYCLLIGPPATRKNAAMEIAKGMLVDAGMDTTVLSGDLTEEGVLNKWMELEAEKKSPAVIVFAPEFGRVVEGKDYKKGVLRFLIDAFDGRERNATRRGGGYGATDSFLTLLGASTPADLRDMPSSTLKTGLVSRTWIASADGPERREWRPKFDKGLRQNLLDRIGEVIRRIPEGPYDPGQECDDWMEKWYMGDHAKQTKGATEEEESWFGRRHDHAIKAGVLMHLLDEGDGQEGIGEVGAARGVELVHALEPGMFKVYGCVGRTPWAEKKETMATKLRKNGGEMDIVALKRAIGSRMMRGDADALLAELDRDGVVKLAGKRVRLLEGGV